MQKTLEKYRSKKKNGGFTLVELIIVIAIMAALVAVLAPQYIQYVNKSRTTADQSTADSILSACRVESTEEGITDDFSVEWNGNNGTLTVTSATSAVQTKVVDDLKKSLSITFGSGTSANVATLTAKTQGTKANTYKVAFDKDNGTVKVDDTNKGWW